ncbi:hypothetical protein [Roseicyclus marinus]
MKYLTFIATSILVILAVNDAQAQTTRPFPRPDAALHLTMLGIAQVRISSLSREQVYDIEIILGQDGLSENEKRDAIDRIMDRRSLTRDEEELFRLYVLERLADLGYSADHFRGVTLPQAIMLEAVLAQRGPDLTRAVIDSLLAESEWPMRRRQSYRGDIETLLENMGFSREHVPTLSWLQLREIDDVLSTSNRPEEARQCVARIILRGNLTLSERMDLLRDLQELRIEGENSVYGALGARELFELRSVLQAVSPDTQRRDRAAAILLHRRMAGPCD